MAARPVGNGRRPGNPYTRPLRPGQKTNLPKPGIGRKPAKGAVPGGKKAVAKPKPSIGKKPPKNRIGIPTPPGRDRAVRRSKRGY